MIIANSGIYPFSVVPVTSAYQVIDMLHSNPSTKWNENEKSLHPSSGNDNDLFAKAPKPLSAALDSVFGGTAFDKGRCGSL